MARSTYAYTPHAFSDAEPRATKQSMGTPTAGAFVDWLGVLSQTAAGVTVTPNNARQCAEVDACIGLIEDTIATVPLELFQRVDQDRSVKADADPLYRLLHDEPNGWQSSAEFRQMMEGWRETHGNAYARIVTGDRGPMALEPEHPDRVRPFRTSDGVAYLWTPIDAPQRVLLASEMLHLRDGKARYVNIVEGESKVVRGRDDIALVMACGIYLSKFFANGGAPKVKVTIPGEVKPETAELLRDRYMRRHGNLEGSQAPLILEGGMDVAPIGQTNTDAEVIGIHGVALSKIARRFGVPLHLIGETDKSTSWGTGIEQQSIGFVTYYMRPKFVVWEQALNRALMSAEKRRTYYWRFDMDALTRGDFKTRMEGYALMIQWGLATPNEIRKLMGFPPVEGGDERLQPLNMAPASRIMDVLLRDNAGKTDPAAADAATRALVAILSATNDVRLPLAA